MAIQAELRLGIRDFKANLDRATSEVKKSAGTMKREGGGVGQSLADGIKAALPALSLAALGAGIKAALTRADDIADLKVALNETAETLQRVDFAAQQTASVGVEDLAKAVIRLEKGLGDVENKKAAEALANFGLTAEELTRLSLDEKIIALSGAFQKARANGTGVKDIMDLLGKSGASLIPMLGQSEEALRDLFENAPVAAEELIDRMAVLNDQFDGLVAKAKTAGIGIVGAWSEVGTFLADLVKTGSLEEALLNFDDRQVEAMRNVQGQRDAKDAQAEAVAEQEAAAEAAAAEAKATDELAKSLEAIAKLKEDIARDKLDLLPDGEKVTALQGNLEKMLKDTVGLFSLNYETSTAGLQKLAEAREKDPRLPAEGQNSAAEAYEWLAKALDLEKQIAALQEKAEKEKADQAEKRAEALEAARKQAEEGGFAPLSPEDQAAKLLQQLEASLGMDVGSSADIDAGLATQREKVAKARAAGDVEAEMAALEELNRSQELAKQFTDAAADLAPEAPDGGVGSLAGIVNQMFGRDPQARQVEAIQRGNDLTKQVKEGIDIVIRKMDEQPPPIAFTRL